MAATISVSPTSPTVGDTVTLTITGATIEPDNEVHEWALSSVPPQSALTTTSILVDETDAAINTFVPDVAGAYGIVGYRYSQASTPAAFDGDGKGESPRILEEVLTTTVNVHDRVELKLHTFTGHGVTLRLGIQDTTIKAASLVDPLTTTSQLAIEDSTVDAAVDALVGVAIASLGPSITTMTNELVTKFEAHRILTAGSVHVAADVVNAVLRDAVSTPAEAIVLLQRLRLYMLQHLTGASTAGSRWHSADDAKNLPIAGSPTDLATGIVSLCELRYRVYNRHRTQTSSPATHGASDTTNTLTAITPLETLIVALFDYLASASPAVPTGEPAGTLAAVALYGFTVTT